MYDRTLIFVENFHVKNLCVVLEIFHVRNFHGTRVHNSLPFTHFTFLVYIQYRSIITSLLHVSPRVAPRAARVESTKSYRGKLRFHVTGRGFSTRRLVAFHDMWHFHETTRGISTRPVIVESCMEFSRDQ